MELSSAGRELLWLELQNANEVQAGIAHREWARHFVLAVLLIVFTVAAATALSKLAGEVIRPLGPPVSVRAGWALKCVTG